MKNSARFETLYRQYYEAIYKFCFRFLNSHDAAMDNSQETFIKLYERMKQQGLEIENTRAWLYKVAGNLCMNSLKSKKRRQEIENLLENQTIENTTPEHILMRDERSTLIRKELSQLKPEQRILILMYQDGLSYTEMAEVTGIKKNSIGKTLWRLIEKISKNIKDEANG